MRLAAGLLLVLVLLAACGTKGPLYLPPEEDAAKQEGKSRQP